MSTNQIVSKVWSFCNTLKDDGVGYGDYLEQLTYLLFLKMADGYSKPPYSRKILIPQEYNWQSVTALRGAELEVHYSILLRQGPLPFSKPPPPPNLSFFSMLPTAAGFNID